MKARSIVAAMAVGLVAVACSDSGASTPTDSSNTSGSVASSPGAPETMPAPPPSGKDGYAVTITRTEYGIPHIVADDWGSLGFGQGYAFAEDRACTLLDQVIKVRGERSKWFGPGDDNANLDSDFAYRHLHLEDDALERVASQPQNIADMVTGYVAGFNRELVDDGPSGWCKGEPWVQPITVSDLYAYLNDTLLFASSGVLLDPIATAHPPADEATADTTADAGAAAMPDLQPDLASNGWAIGSASSESGQGMLLANPHFPWEGEKRLWESQLTLTTGELNVYGVTLSGVPGVLIGFNDHIAWTHTVSAGYRMTLYELALTPGDATSYRYGDADRAMTSEDVSIDVLQSDGSIQPQTRTMWSSHYGPMLELPFGWTTEKAYTLRDANLGNGDALQQFFGMDAATNMDEFIDAHRTANGIPWVNTIATSDDGRAWYADTAATPNLSDAAIAAWQAAVAAGGTAKLVFDNGAILLDGSDPANEWIDDPAATRPGILPFDEQPQLERDDFVFNANDSHWLANPAELLTGYSPLTGPEQVAQTPRTRMNAVLLTDPAVRGDDDRISFDELQQAWLAERGMLSELLLTQVLAACERQPTVAADACTALRGWDGRYLLDSRGVALWREFLASFDNSDLVDAGALFATPFDPADPVNTPNTLVADADVVLGHLADTARLLVDNGFALDATLGDVQFDARVHGDNADDQHIGLPGGTFFDGTASIVDCCSGSNTLAPGGDTGTSLDGLIINDIGYPVTNGNSFVMTLEFTDSGPHAEAVLTYGQPDDPSSPDYTSQTKVYAAGTFRAIRFTDADIAADPTATTKTLSAPRS